MKKAPAFARVSSVLFYVLVSKLGLREIIVAEDPKKPLNDEQLAVALKKAGLVIARRTVTKYRLELGIPAARLRIR